MSISVVIADDHGLVRAGIRALLEQLPDLEVVGEAENGRDAVRLVDELKPRLALLNIAMPELNGLDATARITRDHPRTRVIIVSTHADEEYVRRALSLGAVGYVLKAADRRELELAVHAVLAGDVWLSPSVTRTVVAALARGEASAAPFELLTGRQREILQLVAEGQSTKSIAHGLGISPKTVDAHRAQLMKRLDVRSVAALVRCAIRLGLVRPES
jgi:DNA-binding NarL/FixJ family response regulator